MNATETPLRLRAGSCFPTLKGDEVRVAAWRGEGSYARVYRGVYTRTSSPCALKLAKTEVPEAPGRLAREAKVLSAVEHPRLVALLDANPPGYAPALVLEWLDGETLLDLLAARRRLALRQALEYSEQVLEGVSHLHSRGLAHGDLRPENIIVVPARGAVLTDPEGKPAEGVADVRRVGQLFYRMLTGLDPERDPSRLTAAEGHNRRAVELWERFASAAAPGAGELLGQVRRLRASL